MAKENTIRYRETRKKYREANKEKLYAQAKAWRLANPERVKEQNRKFWDENRDSMTQKEKRREYREKNRDLLRKKARERYERLKPRWRSNDYKRKFGITIEDYSKMFEEQGGRCAICGTDKTGKRRDHFAVDHDHESGKIRGLLCSHCNTGIGHFEENPEFLMKAIDYLNKNK